MTTDNCPRCSADDPEDDNCGGVGPYCDDPWHARPTEADDHYDPPCLVNASDIMAMRDRIVELEAEVSRLTALGDDLAEATSSLVEAEVQPDTGNAAEACRQAIDAWRNR